MRALFREQGASLRIGIIAEEPAQQFIQEHAAILDSSFAEVRMSDTLRQSLSRSNYIFSGIKTFHEMNEAFPSLIDENGNRKPFERFLNDVQKINQTYNRNYLRAEYNFAHASAQMAEKWEQFQQDGDEFNLQYRTVQDGRVRPSHAALDRITLPPSHPFWQQYFPPNGWNCRCNVVQVLKGKYPTTPDTEVEHLTRQNDDANPKEQFFRFNPGIERKTFPDYNPYTIRRCNDCDIAKGNLKLAFIPTNMLCQGCQLIRECYENQQKSENAVIKKHYLHQMNALKGKKVIVNGNGHPMNVEFNQYGNKHLYHDAFHGKIDKEELLSLDKMLQNAIFVKKTGLSKTRENDDFKRFYYYRTVNRYGVEIFLNVGETDYKTKRGMIKHKRYLYAITYAIKEE